MLGARLRSIVSSIGLPLLQQVRFFRKQPQTHVEKGKSHL